MPARLSRTHRADAPAADQVMARSTGRDGQTGINKHYKLRTPINSCAGTTKIHWTSRSNQVGTNGIEAATKGPVKRPRGSVSKENRTVPHRRRHGGDVRRPSTGCRVSDLRESGVPATPPAIASTVVWDEENVSRPGLTRRVRCRFRCQRPQPPPGIPQVELEIAHRAGSANRTGRPTQ